MLIGLGFATIVLLVLTLLPLLRQKHWVVRSMDFPRLQLAVLALVLIGADIWLGLQRPAGWGLLAIALPCLAWQAWWIAPYTRLWRTEVRPADSPDEQRRLRIITSNVLGTNRDADKLLHLVRTREPDLLVTLETDDWWQGQLDTLLPDMPYSIKCPLDNLYGMHVYSRLPLEAPQIAYLVEPDKPSMHMRVRLRSGHAIRVHCLHPAPPSPSENESSSERDAELVVVARSVAGQDAPIIVTGDLNDVAWSSTTRLFRKLSGLLDPRVGRGMFNTFHAKYPFLRWPLDHLFHSAHFTIGKIERLPSIGSDHFPLLAEIWFTPADGLGQEGIDADAEDRARAEEDAAEQNVGQAEVPKP
ncbi:MAG: endonuclease/exonuclease/phosphatase family protein [Burkholderiaceae bacterium]